MPCKPCTDYRPYTDPTTGEWIGEHETRRPDGEVRRQTEWFPTWAQAVAFNRYGQAPEAAAAD